MVNIVLSAKAWHVFLVICVIPLCSFFVLLEFLKTNPEPMFKVFPLVMLSFRAVLLIWFWCLGIGLNNCIYEGIRSRSGFFKFAIIYAAVDSVLVEALIVLFAVGELLARYIVIIVPLRLLGIFCMFYCVYFISKNIAMCERGREVRFSEFSGSFFLLFLFPIGIWLLQPRINRIYANPDTVDG